MMNTITSAAGGFAGTPSEEHVRAFLPSLAPHDAEAITHLLDDGALVACPICHFLYLPRLPFGIGTDAPAGAAGCDVCAHAARPNASVEDYIDEAQQTDDLRELIAAARTARAGVLLELWSGTVRDAELWLVACAAEVS